MLNNYFLIKSGFELYAKNILFFLSFSLDFSYFFFMNPDFWIHVFYKIQWFFISQDTSYLGDLNESFQIDPLRSWDQANLFNWIESVPSDKCLDESIASRITSILQSKLGRGIGSKDPKTTIVIFVLVVSSPLSSWIFFSFSIWIIRSLRTKHFSTRWMTIQWYMSTLDDQPYQLRQAF